MKNRRRDGVVQDRDPSKANHSDAEKETLEEQRQQERGRDIKPGGIDKDKMRRPRNR